MAHLIRARAIRAGTIIRVLDYLFIDSDINTRVIIVQQLELLQTECALIGTSNTHASPNAYNMLHSDMVAAVRMAHACCMFLDELSTTYLFPAHHNVNVSTFRSPNFIKEIAS
uniref:Uncharacterized protein n=1 Tax=Oryza glumipatula TaxID=40148 RepID=A0A0D9Y4P6_9ORYZ